MAAAFTEYAGTLTNGAVTIPANPRRRGMIIGNPSDTVMTWRIGATATATVGVPIAAGSDMAFRDNWVPADSVTLFCAGASKAYTIYEW